MCGITGKLHFNPEQTIPTDLIQRMNNALTHRGPDSEGIWIEGQIGLAQRRLAIVDLSPTGYQPMSNADGTIWITFNGEIYNHPELQPQLEAKGYTYRGTSDTQTILYLYEEYGRDCVKHLRGMFAFALWDSRDKSLLLARDRFGQKPMLYAETTDGLAFGSEIKALVQDPTVPLDVDPIAIHDYLTFGYVPTPKTVFQHITKLPPAHTLLWRDGECSIEPYWSLDYEPKLKISEDEAAEETLRLLREATKIRLMSDVPLGAFLSGGIDSSAIVALMSEMSSDPVKTFTIGFGNDSFDETEYADQVAERYKTDHQKFVVESKAADILNELVWAYGEPYADSSALPTYYVSKMTRQHVTVALNGDGGDEAFAGYDRYFANQLAQKYEKIPQGIRRNLISPIVNRFPESTEQRAILRRIKRFVQATDKTPERRYAQWITLMTNEFKTQLYSAEFKNKVVGKDSIAKLENLYGSTSANHFIDKTLSVDVHSYLPDDLLAKVDIATMIHSLEGRSPFLDHKLAEFAAQLPVEYKLRGRTHKYILKKALKNHLSDNILHRPKQGFGVPVGHWFRHELKNLAYDVLLDRRSVERGIFDPNEIKKMLDEHVSGQANHWQRIWAVFMLELWFRSYVDRSRSELVAPTASLL